MKLTAMLSVMLTAYVVHLTTPARADESNLTNATQFSEELLPVNNDQMNTKRLMLLLAGLTMAAVGCDQKPEVSQRLVRPPATIGVTYLVACQAIPPQLSDNLRGWYGGFCSATNTEERIQRLIHFPYVHVSEQASEKVKNWEVEGIRLGSSYIQQSEIVVFLPLFSEVLATDDFIWLRGVPCYVAEYAAVMMSRAGADAVPFVIKALQSNKPVEIHAALRCAREIVAAMERKDETNTVSAICGQLLPYVAMNATNSVKETQWEAQGFYHFVPDDAKETELELEKFIPSATSNK